MYLNVQTKRSEWSEYYQMFSKFIKNPKEISRMFSTPSF